MKFFNPLKKRKTQSELPTFDSIVESYKPKIGKDFNGYRNHCYRVFQFCQALSDKELGEEDSQKLQIALAFHDLGLFTDNTVDYLPPSMTLADEYRKINKLDSARYYLSRCANSNSLFTKAGYYYFLANIEEDAGNYKKSLISFLFG